MVGKTKPNINIMKAPRDWKYIYFRRKLRMCLLLSDACTTDKTPGEHADSIEKRLGPRPLVPTGHIFKANRNSDL